MWKNFGGPEKTHFPRLQNSPRRGEHFGSLNFFARGAVPPPLAVCQTIFIEISVGFFGALVKASLPKNIIPPAGGNYFSEIFGKILSLIYEKPKYVWPCQSFFGKVRERVFGGTRKRGISPKTKIPPPGGIIFRFPCKFRLRIWGTPYKWLIPPIQNCIEFFRWPDKPSFPKNTNPPAGGNYFSENLGILIQTL